MSRHRTPTTYDHRSHTQEHRTSRVTPNPIITFRFCCKWVFRVPQWILEYLMGGLHQHILFYLHPGRSISIAYDHRRHPEEPQTRLISLNTIITFRFCGKWVFDVPQEILKKLMEGLHQHSLFYLCSGTTYDHWSHPQEPKTSIVSSNRIITLRFRCKWVFGVLLKIVIFLIWRLCWHRLFYLCQGIQFQLHMTRGATHRNLGHT